jgi:glycosidase
MTVTDSEGFLPHVKIFLFEKSGDGRVMTCAGGFENATNDQKAFTNFLSGLLHFRSDSSAYSLNPRAYPAKPLFADDDKNPTLNDLFWLIFDNMHNWQNLSCLYATSTEDRMRTVERLLDGVPPTTSGTGFSSYPLVSAHLIAYIEALIVETPFFYAGSETRMCGVGDGQFLKMMDMYEVFEEAEFSDYVTRKARRWYERFPIVIGHCCPSPCFCKQ